MSNDTYVQAWFDFNENAFLEADSAAAFNPSNGSDVVAAVLFKVPGFQAPQGDNNFPNLPGHLWGNIDGTPGTSGWALELIDDDGSGGTGLSLCARVGGGAGKAIYPLAGSAAPGDAIETGCGLIERLILAVLHCRSTFTSTAIASRVA